MSGKRYTEEFKAEAAKQVIEQGRPAGSRRPCRPGRSFIAPQSLLHSRHKFGVRSPRIVIQWLRPFVLDALGIRRHVPMARLALLIQLPGDDRAIREEGLYA